MDNVSNQHGAKSKVNNFAVLIFANFDFSHYHGDAALSPRRSAKQCA